MSSGEEPLQCWTQLFFHSSDWYHFLACKQNRVSQCGNRPWQSLQRPCQDIQMPFANSFWVACLGESEHSWAKTSVSSPHRLGWINFPMLGKTGRTSHWSTSWSWQDKHKSVSGTLTWGNASRTWWHPLVIPAIWETEVGESLEPKISRLAKPFSKHTKVWA